MSCVISSPEKVEILLHSLGRHSLVRSQGIPLGLVHQPLSARENSQRKRHAYAQIVQNSILGIATCFDGEIYCWKSLREKTNSVNRAALYLEMAYSSGDRVVSGADMSPR